MVLVGKNCTLLNELIRSSLKIPAKEQRMSVFPTIQAGRIDKKMEAISMHL